MEESAINKRISNIRKAFGHVRLEDGISLNMTEYMDSHGDPTYLIRAKSDESDDWQRIPDEVLEKFTVTFPFTDGKGYRFYLPAYMIYTLKTYKTSSSRVHNHPRPK